MEDSLCSADGSSALYSRSRYAHPDPGHFLPSSFLEPPAAAMRLSNPGPPSAGAPPEVSVHHRNRETKDVRGRLLVESGTALRNAGPRNHMFSCDAESGLTRPFPLSSAVRPSPRPSCCNSPSTDDEEEKGDSILFNLFYRARKASREHSIATQVSGQRFAEGHAAAVAYLSRPPPPATLHTGDAHASQKRSFSSGASSPTLSTEPVRTPRLDPNAFSLPAKPARRSQSVWHGGRSFSRNGCPPSNSAVLLASPESSPSYPVQPNRHRETVLCDAVHERWMRRTLSPDLSPAADSLSSTQVSSHSYSSPSSSSSASSSSPSFSSSVSSSSPCVSSSTSVSRAGERGRGARRIHGEERREERVERDAGGVVESAGSSRRGEKWEKVHNVPPPSCVRRELRRREMNHDKEEELWKTSAEKTFTDTNGWAQAAYFGGLTHEKTSPNAWTSADASSDSRYAAPRTHGSSFSSSSSSSSPFSPFSSFSCHSSASSSSLSAGSAFPVSSSIRSSPLSPNTAAKKTSSEGLLHSSVGTLKEDEKRTVLRLGGGLVGLFQGDSSPGDLSSPSSSSLQSSSPHGGSPPCRTSPSCVSPSPVSLCCSSHASTSGVSCLPRSQAKKNHPAIPQPCPASQRPPACAGSSSSGPSASSPRSLDKDRSSSLSPFSLSPRRSSSSLSSLSSLATHSFLPSSPSLSSLETKEDRHLQSSLSSLCEASLAGSTPRDSGVSAARSAFGVSPQASFCGAAARLRCVSTARPRFACASVHALEKPEDDDFQLVLPPSPAALRRAQQEEGGSSEEEDGRRSVPEEEERRQPSKRPSMRERLGFFRRTSRRGNGEKDGPEGDTSGGVSNTLDEGGDTRGVSVEKGGELEPRRSLRGFGSTAERGEKSRSRYGELESESRRDQLPRRDSGEETRDASFLSLSTGEKKAQEAEGENLSNPFSADVQEGVRGESLLFQEARVVREETHADKGQGTPGGIRSALKRPERSDPNLHLDAARPRSISFGHVSGSFAEEDAAERSLSRAASEQREGEAGESRAAVLHRRSTVRWKDSLEEGAEEKRREEKEEESDSCRSEEGEAASAGAAAERAGDRRDAEPGEETNRVAALRDRRKSSFFSAVRGSRSDDDVDERQGDSRGSGVERGNEQRYSGGAALDTIPPSPSYLFTQAATLHELLELPPSKYFNLSAEIQRQRSLFPRRWVEETLLVHQSLLLFCASLRPLCVRVMIPLSNVQSVAPLDVNLRERERRKATKRGWRLKILHTENPQGGRGKPQEVVCRFRQETDMQAWTERLSLLAHKWRQRPAVPDLLYRPPCQAQLAEVSQDIHRAALTLLSQRLFFACCESLRAQFRLFFFQLRVNALQKQRRDSEKSIRADARRACAAAARREGAARLQLLLEKKLRSFFGDLRQQAEREHLHDMQARRLAVAVAVIEKEEETVGRHISHWRRKSLALILSAALHRRLLWALTHLAVATRLEAAKKKQRSAGAAYLEDVVRRLQRRSLRRAFQRLWRARNEKNDAEKLLARVAERLRRRHLARGWQRLMQHSVDYVKTRATKSDQAKGKAVELCLLSIEKRRLAAAFSALKQRAHAAREDERNAVCRNMQQVNETLRAAALRVPQQRGFLLLAALVKNVERFSLFASFSIWKNLLRRGRSRETALVRVARIVETKEKRMKELGLSAFLRSECVAKERLCRKRAGASLLAACLSSTSRRILGVAWTRLSLHGEERQAEREMKGLFVLEKIRRRRLQFFFTQMQREAACGRDLRVFLRSHVLHAFVHLLALRRIKLLSACFQRLRVFSSSVPVSLHKQDPSVHAVPGNVSPPGHIRDGGEKLPLPSEMREEAAAAVDRLQDLLRLSEELLERQEKLFSSSDDDEAPSVVVPQNACFVSLSTSDLRGERTEISGSAETEKDLALQHEETPGGCASEESVASATKKEVPSTRGHRFSAETVGSETSGEAREERVNWADDSRTFLPSTYTALLSGAGASRPTTAGLFPAVGTMVSPLKSTPPDHLSSPTFSEEVVPLFAGPSPDRASLEQCVLLPQCSLRLDEEREREWKFDPVPAALAFSLSRPASYPRVGDAFEDGGSRQLVPPSGILFFEDRGQMAHASLLREERRSRELDREIDALVEHLKQKADAPFSMPEAPQRSTKVLSKFNPEVFVPPSSPSFHASASPAPWKSARLNCASFKRDPVSPSVPEFKKKHVSPGAWEPALGVSSGPPREDARELDVCPVFRSLSPCAAQCSRLCGFLMETGSAKHSGDKQKKQSRAGCSRRVASAASRVRCRPAQPSVDTLHADGTRSSSASVGFHGGPPSAGSTLASFPGLSETHNPRTLPSHPWSAFPAGGCYAPLQVDAEKSGRNFARRLPFVGAPAHAVDADPGVLSPGAPSYRFVRR
ncbi:UNVERIFIED_CONTAM: hypothetical protein HHA_319900 [Hammondia hammondi]|eukprot:XP_008885176.1 hypothetical protein HHA_319900 [Hammondia hammondi]